MRCNTEAELCRSDDFDPVGVNFEVVGYGLLKAKIFRVVPVENVRYAVRDATTDNIDNRDPGVIEVGPKGLDSPGDIIG